MKNLCKRILNGLKEKFISIDKYTKDFSFFGQKVFVYYGRI
jgi:hypothetical protein